VHDTCEEPPARRTILAGEPEAARRATVTGLSGKLTKNVQRRLIIFDEKCVDRVCVSVKRKNFRNMFWANIGRRRTARTTVIRWIIEASRPGFSARIVRRGLRWAKAVNDLYHTVGAEQRLRRHVVRATSPQPCGPYPYLVARRLPASPLGFGQAHFVSDDTLFVTGYEYSEDRRRLIKACFNGQTAIWEPKLDPVEFQL